MKLSWSLMVVSALADILMTTYNIGIYGIEIEGNPVLRYIMEWIGPLAGIFLCKAVGIGLITYTVSRIPEDYDIGGRYVKNYWLYYIASFVWFYGALSHVVAILMN